MTIWGGFSQKRVSQGNNGSQRQAGSWPVVTGYGLRFKGGAVQDQIQSSGKLRALWLKPPSPPSLPLLPPPLETGAAAHQDSTLANACTAQTAHGGQHQLNAIRKTKEEQRNQETKGLSGQGKNGKEQE